MLDAFTIPDVPYYAHPHVVERDRLNQFAELLRARAYLLHMQYLLEHARKTNHPRSFILVREMFVSRALDSVWKEQQECIAYEQRHPLRR